MKYDALLVVSFGGPEGREDVLPFLENVLRGKNVPRERMLAVAEHYYQFGGVSPLPAQCRELISALEAEFRSESLELPIYWGNRNWHPLLADTFRQMRDDGCRHVLAFMTSAYSSYSGCRQYREDIERARSEVHAADEHAKTGGVVTPTYDKIRVFYNHPGFIEPMIENVRAAYDEISAEHRQRAKLIFTAHSIPLSMADQCQYQHQLTEAARLTATGAGKTDWRLVYQSRSGPPQQPWLEPDICDYLTELHGEGVPAAVVCPIGFLSDHLEVVYDLDTEAKALCAELGMEMARTKTVGVHPRFVKMIVELVRERLEDRHEKLALGNDGPSHDVCPPDCCRLK